MQLTALSLALTRIGLGGFGVGSALNLDFTSGNQSLDPRITFSRASNATVTGPDGVLGYAPHNLLTFSEQFDAGAWNKGIATSFSANAIAAPDESLTADTFTITSGADNGVYQSVAVVPGTTYTQSWYVKLGTLSASVYRFALYNNTASSFIAQDIVPTQTPTSAEWTRITYTFTVPAGCTSVRIYPNRSPSATSGTYSLWGAQLNVGPLQPYYPTTVKNLLGFTQEFDNAAWTKTASSIGATKVTAPDGSLTGQKLVESATSAEHFLLQFAPVLSGTRYTGSIYAKKGERSWLRVAFSSGVGLGLADRIAWFNLDAGTLGTQPGGGSTSSITATGDGWYRCSLTLTSAASASVGFVPTLADADYGSGAAAYTGDGTSGIYIWGAQLSDSASLDPYVYNPAAAPAASAYYGPRFDYDPVTLQPKGLLIEEQRTNITPYSRYETGAWSLQATSVGTETKAGIDGTTVTAFLTDTSTTAHRVVRAVTNAYAANSVYSFSVYVAKPAASDIRGVILRLRTTIGGQAVTVSVSNDGAESTYTFSSSSPFGTNPPSAITAADFSATPVGNGWVRLSIKTAAATVDTNFTQWDIGFSSGLAGDTGAGTANSQLFIDGAQLEVGAFPTSYIPTTTAAATRAADVAVITGANFSNWYRQDEGTLFAEYVLYANTNREILNVNDGTSANSLSVRLASGAQAQYAVAISGVTEVNIAPSGYSTIGDMYKRAVTYKPNDFAHAINGALVGTDSLGSLPAVSAMNIGSTPTSLPGVGAYIRKIAYFPRRLTNAELQGITK